MIFTSRKRFGETDLALGTSCWEREKKLTRHNVGRGVTASITIPEDFFSFSIKESKNPDSRVGWAGVGGSDQDDGRITVSQG